LTTAVHASQRQMSRCHLHSPGVTSGSLYVHDVFHLHHCTCSSSRCPPRPAPSRPAE